MTTQKKKNGSDKTAKSDFFSNLNNPQHAFAIAHIRPRTANQEKMFDLFAEGYNIFAHGYPGTGKTMLSMYLGLSDILSNENSRDTLIIVRSVVPSRDMGFLPGSSKDKAKVYEAPYADVCQELVPGRTNAYEALKSAGLIEFTTTSFLRGITFRNAVIYIDEIQNLADHEIHTVMTRIGEGCRLIVSGDVRQTDLARESEKLGCRTFIDIMNTMRSFESIEFGVEDILRSDLVAEYITARMWVLDGKIATGEP